MTEHDDIMARARAAVDQAYLEWGAIECESTRLAVNAALDRLVTLAQAWRAVEAVGNIWCNGDGKETPCAASRCRVLKDAQAAYQSAVQAVMDAEEECVN